MLFFEILNQSCASVFLSNRLTCPELEQALGLRQSWVETAETRGLVAASKGPGTLRQYDLTAMNDDMESTFKKVSVSSYIYDNYSHYSDATNFA